MLSGNLPFTWRNSEDQRMHPSCCLCGEKWKSYEHIVLHITKYCSQVNIRPINFCEIDKFLRDWQNNRNLAQRISKYFELCQKQGFVF